MAVGVTVTVAVTGFAELFVAEKEAVFPVPLTARPIVGSEFVHENVVPGVVLVKTPAAIVAPLQTVMFAGTTTTGIGSTVMEYETGVPGQPLEEGVTVTVEVTELEVLFVPVNDGVFPAPLAARPIVVLEFVHVKVVPGVVLVKLYAAIVTPLQTVTFAGTATTGVGFIVIV